MFTIMNENYISYAGQYDQLAREPKPVTLINEDTSVDVNPLTLLDGSGFAYLVGQINIDANPIANMPLCQLPENVAPIADYHIPVNVLRSGASVSNAIKIQAGGNSIDAVVITDDGEYFSMPTLSTSGPGLDATFAPTMICRNLVGTAPGQNYAAGDTLIIAGGTYTTPVQLIVDTTQLVSLAVFNPGDGYRPGDTITTESDGVAVTDAVITVETTTVTVLSIGSGGTGYKVGDTIVLRPTPVPDVCTVQPIIRVSTVSSGVITSFTILNGGSFFILSGDFVQDSTSGTGTGATFTNAFYGVLTISTPNTGAYTTNPTFLDQASTSGSGVAATFNTLVLGIRDADIDSISSYTVLPTNNVSQASTSGIGTGATFNLYWGFSSIDVTDGGFLFTPQSKLIFSGGDPVIPATAYFALTQQYQGLVTLINEPVVGDVVYLDTPPIFLRPFE